mmetsp:Transcript_3694/g.9613  ORF Transcript_3694/g.9613 Transcript_3694/m.9613 type:complete len:310 (-) Transcript_3694:160-1089(-)
MSWSMLSSRLRRLFEALSLLAPLGLAESSGARRLLSLPLLPPPPPPPLPPASSSVAATRPGLGCSRSRARRPRPSCFRLRTALYAYFHMARAHSVSRSLRSSSSCVTVSSEIFHPSMALFSPRRASSRASRISVSCTCERWATSVARRSEFLAIRSASLWDSCCAWRSSLSLPMTRWWRWWRVFFFLPLAPPLAAAGGCEPGLALTRLVTFPKVTRGGRSSPGPGAFSFKGPSPLSKSTTKAATSSASARTSSSSSSEESKKLSAMFSSIKGAMISGIGGRNEGRFAFVAELQSMSTETETPSSRTAAA